MHSLKELYDTWTENFREQNIDIDCKDVRGIENVIEFVDEFDFSSTFLRYPFNKHGERNRKGLVEKIDDEILFSLPCSLGALVFHEGPEKFSCIHREQHLDYIEFEIKKLIQSLIHLYTGRVETNNMVNP